MRSQAQNAASFLVRVWVEEPADERGVATWRGHITELPHGRPRYFEDLDRMTAVVAAHLQEMGVPPERLQGGGERTAESE